MSGKVILKPKRSLKWWGSWLSAPTRKNCSKFYNSLLVENRTRQYKTYLLNIASVAGISEAIIYNEPYFVEIRYTQVLPKFACQKTMVFVVRLIYVMFCALKLCSEKKRLETSKSIPSFFVESNAKKMGGSFSILDTTSNPSVFQLREFCFRSSGSAPLWKSSCTILSAELNQMLGPTILGKPEIFLGGVKKFGNLVRVKYNPRWNLLGYFFWQFFFRGFYHGARFL